MRDLFEGRSRVWVDVLSRPSTTHDSSLAVHRGPEPIPISVQADAEALRVSSPGITAYIQKNPVRLHLYDTLGRRVRTLLDRKQAGRREQRVDVSSLSSGMYFLRLRVGETVLTERVTVVR